MIDLRVKLYQQRVNVALAKAPKAAYRGVRRGFQRALIEFRHEFQSERLRKSGDARNSPNDPRPGLFSRRGGAGGLRSALTHKLSGNSVETLEGKVGWISDEHARIAWVHEEGKTIRPTRSMYLTVPLPEAMTPAGVPRRPGARHWENTFVARADSGHLIIWQKRGKARMVALYVLRRSVRIPARLEFVKTFHSREMTRKRMRTLNKELSKAFGK